MPSGVTVAGLCCAGLSYCQHCGVCTLVIRGKWYLMVGLAAHSTLTNEKLKQDTVVTVPSSEP